MEGGEKQQQRFFVGGHATGRSLCNAGGSGVHPICRHVQESTAFALTFPLFCGKIKIAKRLPPLWRRRYVRRFFYWNGKRWIDGAEVNGKTKNENSG